MVNDAQDTTNTFERRSTISMKYKVFMIVGLFILVSILILGLSWVQSETMNSVRSYVRGEGLWSKAQKDAVFHLQRYARTRNHSDYQLFLRSLKVPLGDQQARLTLQSARPDYNKAFNSFLAGQNHPDDIDGMIQFFLRFQKFPYMSDAISVWSQADAAILKLKALGQKIRLAREQGHIQQLEALLQQVEDLNWQLASLEYRFSAVLSEGARWVKTTLMQVSLALLIALLIPVLLVTRHIVIGIERTEKDLQVSERRFRSLYESNMLGIIDWDINGDIHEANDAFLDMMGYSKNDLEEIQLNWRELTPQDGYRRDNQALSEIAELGYCTPFKKEFLHQDGHRVPVFLGAARLDGETERAICFVIDQTEQKQSETEMRLSATVFNASSNGIMITDKDKRIITVNKAFSELSGYPADELIGHSTRALRSGLMPNSVYNDMWSMLKSSGHWHGDVLDRKRDGSIFPVHLSINSVHDDEGEVSHYVAIFSDISERVAAENQLRKMAHYDFLTGLANRNLFSERLKQAIQRATRHSSIFALLFFDLDRFKPVNDSYGHEVGDKLLQIIGERLQNFLRETDTIARLGGDEFVIILEDLNKPQDAATTAEKIIAAINQPCRIDEHDIQIGCSIGISIFPDDSKEAIGLTRCADIAMYAAKGTGRNQYYYYHRQNSPSPKEDGTNISPL